eukprot:365920-Chlamydomonas_euryale.AAC.2
MAAAATRTPTPCNAVWCHAPCRRTFYNDVLRLDTACRRWEQLSVHGSERFGARASHTATLVGRTIWVIGGCTSEACYSAWLPPNSSLHVCMHARGQAGRQASRHT